MSINNISSDAIYAFLVKRVKEKELLIKAAKSKFDMMHGVLFWAVKDKMIRGIHAIMST